MRVLEEDLCVKGAFNQNSESCESTASGTVGCRGTGGSEAEGTVTAAPLGRERAPDA